MPGHQFTKDFKPKPSPFNSPSPSSSGFSDLEKMIGNDLNNKFNQPGGFGGGGMGGGGMGSFGGNPYQNLDPRGFMGNNGGNPGNMGFNSGPGGNQYVGGPGGNVPGGNTPGSSPANMGPDFFVPVEVPAKDKGVVKQSIKDIKDIDYYPEMDANPALFNKGEYQDPDFDQICERLKKGL